MRLPDTHPGMWDLQQALNPNLEGPRNHWISSDEHMEDVRVTTAYVRMYFPFDELDETISKLLNPATTTRLSKQGIKYASARARHRACI